MVLVLFIKLGKKEMINKHGQIMHGSSEVISENCFKFEYPMLHGYLYE